MYHNEELKTQMKRLLTAVVAFLFLMSAGAQSDVLVNISHDPHADSIFFAKMQGKMQEIRVREGRPTVAVVLAGGGAKGAAHIGVLEYLEKKGIPVDFIAGTSMGALVGGLYAMGYSATEIDSIVDKIDWNVMMSDNIPMEYYSYKRNNYKRTYMVDIPFTGTEFLNSLPSGYIHGLNIYNMLSTLTVGYQQYVDFTELPTPFCCVATEIVTQTEKHWTSGSMIDAMRSTMSIPGYFSPVRVDSMILSDGGTKNNFPTDIAKAAGADIIIGVELTMPRDYSKVNNVADILMQTTQYSGGLEAHNRNVKNATIYITPDISGYKALSFGTDEIKTLIRRGYNEAVKHSSQIDSIANIVGRSGRVLYNKKAVNTSNESVKINAVEFEGLTWKEQRYMNRKLRLKEGAYYDKREFEIDQSIIYGTMAFSDVTYRLLQEDDGGYRLRFICNKRPSNSLGIGLRADSEEWFAAMLNFGFGGNKLYGFEFDINARLAISPHLQLQVVYLPIVGPKVGASLLCQYRTVFGSDNQMFSRSYYEQSLRNAVDVYIAGTRWSRVELRAGFRVEQMPFYRIISENGVVQVNDWKKFYPFAYFRFVFDKENNHYFPDKGLRVSLDYDYGLSNTHFIASSFRGIIPVCSFFHIIPSVHLRYIFGEYNNYVYMNNYVGGVSSGRHYAHQIPFFGFNGEKECMDFLNVVDVDFRFKFLKRCYLSLLGAALHDGNRDGMRDHAIYAAALQFGYKTKIGPLLANVHWNSFNHKFGVYLGLGYDF